MGGDYNPLSDKCLFVGSIAPHKGVVEAAKLAAYLGKRLIVAGDMFGWYADEVKAHHNVEYVGPVDGLGKRLLIEQSYAVMCLSNNYADWSEPGCGVVGEANAMNVPVFALNNGCLPEIVEHCKNGWIADNWFQLVDATLKCPSITTSRQHAEQWSIDKIAAQYVELYNRVINGDSWG
jgi:glycosyltransferase involved in cell wall biosynthesis